MNSANRGYYNVLVSHQHSLFNATATTTCCFHSPWPRDRYLLLALLFWTGLVSRTFALGGAERLVVDAALGLKKLGHSVDIYTSYHDPGHCFEETRDGVYFPFSWWPVCTQKKISLKGSLSVHNIKPPFPQSFKGKFHILFAHLRQLHLTSHILSQKKKYDVYFVDQLATCVPFLRLIGQTRVVFYCHFPDKLLANGAFVEGQAFTKDVSLVKRIYRLPMDWLEEITTGKWTLFFFSNGRPSAELNWRTGQADVILANSLFTARVFKSYFPSIERLPLVVYPGINIAAYETPIDSSAPEVVAVSSYVAFNGSYFISIKANI